MQSGQPKQTPMTKQYLEMHAGVRKRHPMARLSKYKICILCTSRPDARTQFDTKSAICIHSEQDHRTSLLLLQPMHSVEDDTELHIGIREHRSIIESSEGTTSGYPFNMTIPTSFITRPSPVPVVALVPGTEHTIQQPSGDSVRTMLSRRGALVVKWLRLWRGPLPNLLDSPYLNFWF